MVRLISDIISGDKDVRHPDSAREGLSKFKNLGQTFWTGIRARSQQPCLPGIYGEFFAAKNSFRAYAISFQSIIKWHFFSIYCILLRVFSFQDLFIFSNHSYPYFIYTFLRKQSLTSKSLRMPKFFFTLQRNLTPFF